MTIRLRRLSSSWAIVLSVAFVLYGVLATALVLGARGNADEGFYAASAFSVHQGLMPYRDFGYTQAPLLPFLNARLMNVTGFGVLQQRWLDLAWGAATLAFMAYLLRRLNVAAWFAAATLLSWVGCLAAMYFSIVGKTYPFAQFAVLVCAVAFVMRASLRIRFVWLALWGTIAVATRLTVAPAVVVLWIGLVAQHGRSTPFVTAVLAPAVAAAAAFGPFFAADFENARFWMWEFHLGYAGPRAPLRALAESAALAPSITALVLAALVAMLVGRRLTSSGWLLLAGVAGWMVSVAASGAFGEYAVPLWPLVLVGAAGQLDSWAEKGLSRVILAIGLPGLSLCGLSNPLIKQYRPWFDSGYHRSVRLASAALREHTAADDVIFASMPEIPLAAGRAIRADLVMGKFGFTAEMDPATAERRHFLTFTELVEGVREGVPSAVVITPSMSWSFGLTFPSFQMLPEEMFGQFVTQLRANYSAVYWDERFAVFVRKSSLEPPKNSAAADSTN